jgi:hypothetical protein
MLSDLSPLLNWRNIAISLIDILLAGVDLGSGGFECNRCLHQPSFAV